MPRLRLVIFRYIEKREPPLVQYEYVWGEG